MINLIKKDFILIFSNKRKLYFLVFAVPMIMLLIGYFSEGSAYYLGLLAILFISTSADEGIEGKSSVLLPSLPINKYHIVISQYLSTYIAFFLSSIYIISVLFILRKLGFYWILSYYNIDLIKYFIALSIISFSISIPIKLFTNKDSRGAASFVGIALVLRYSRMMDEGLKSFKLSSAENRILAIIVAASFVLSIAGSLLEYKDRQYY